MPTPLLDYARRMMIDPKALRVDSPVLIWTWAGAAAKQLPLTTDPGGQRAKRPVEGQSLVFEVKKQPGKPNPFSFGVTIGRIDSNDVAIEDGSVSRFHAWLAQADRGWVVCDAESSNGTWLRDQKLAPNVKTPLDDGSLLRFGDVPLQFLLPTSFLTRLKLLAR